MSEDQLAPLITALQSTSQEQLPITMAAADGPQLVGRTGNARSYTERLFEFAPVDRLDDNDARDALITFPPPGKESNSNQKPSRRFCARRTDIRTSFRNGASITGIQPTIPRSC